MRAGPDRLESDHVVPLRRGGDPWDMAKLRRLCETCLADILALTENASAVRNRTHCLTCGEPLPEERPPGTQCCSSACDKYRSNLRAPGGRRARLGAGRPRG